MSGELPLVSGEGAADGGARAAHLIEQDPYLRCDRSCALFVWVKAWCIDSVHAYVMCSVRSVHLLEGSSMGKGHVRTHTVLPREVIDEVDQLIGHRRRSQFMTEAVREKLRRGKLTAALAATAGVLKDVDIPHWATPDKTSAWVRDLRREDDAATDQTLQTWKAE
jgi:hypothetical protein